MKCIKDQIRSEKQMASYISTRKAQIWSLEFIVGLIIFISALFIFFKYSINLSETQDVVTKELIIDARTLSDYLMSEGFPENWNITNIVYPGLTDNNYRINETKLYYLTQLNYYSAKNLLSVVNDYYVFFEDRNKTSIAINGTTGFGKPGINRTNLNQTEDPSDIIQVYRFVLYNSSIIKMGILIW